MMLSVGEMWAKQGKNESQIARNSPIMLQNLRRLGIQRIQSGSKLKKSTGAQGLILAKEKNKRGRSLASILSRQRRSLEIRSLRLNWIVLKSLFDLLQDIRS
jgi:hypothetical protein